MEKPKAVLLLTRPDVGNARFRAQLSRELRSHLLIIEHPLITITPLVTSLDLSGTDRVIFTSQTAVQAASNLTDQRVPSFCVGRQTTKAACQAGWRAKMLGLDSAALVEALLTRPLVDHILHLRGAHTRGNIVSKLVSAGYHCDEVAIYDQVLQPISQDVLDLLTSETPVIVPLFSPRAAQYFAENTPQARNLTLIALSDAVAAPLQSLHYEALHVSKIPEAVAMVDILTNIVAQSPGSQALG